MIWKQTEKEQKLKAKLDKNQKLKEFENQVWKANQSKIIPGKPHKDLRKEELKKKEEQWRKEIKEETQIRRAK